MAIPSRPLSQDPVSQQLWNISKQLETLIKVVSQGNVYLTTTSTTTAGPSTTTTTTTPYPLDFSYLDFGTSEAIACANTGGNIYAGIAQGETIGTISIIFANFPAAGYNAGAVLYFRWDFFGEIFTKQFTVDAGAQTATATGNNTSCPV